ncbi:DUF3817 domain-containing protein [Alkalihalobacillus sp. 1P02AB]|uniref:DUF3817 domain-containing protein n=1 Tax=Alkalihalobacillus sp. 1P02AB TaxID=3132260 RepID=UPI0039A57F26
MNMSTRTFRVISYLEGISLILLLFLAMPLKYLFDLPSFVTVIGMAHGWLFIIYIITVIVMMFIARWSFAKGGLAMLASIIPFGPFIFDRKLLHSKQPVS